MHESPRGISGARIADGETYIRIPRCRRRETSLTRVNGWSRLGDSNPRTYALREPLPVLTLALTRHSTYRIGSSRVALATLVDCSSLHEWLHGRPRRVGLEVGRVEPCPAPLQAPQTGVVRMPVRVVGRWRWPARRSGQSVPASRTPGPAMVYCQELPTVIISRSNRRASPRISAQVS
jgi:hypothetical protein